MQGKLYIVGTPIGNMGDMTDRAKKVLRDVDIIAAEDTRTTKRLLNILGIENKMVSNHKFNEHRQSQYLISRLEQGDNVAIVSDAGTPCISDPGFVIVKSAIDKGITVTGVCGASSVATALSVSGFNISSYAFFGFFPRTNKDARDILRNVRNSSIPVSVFFESPRRIEKTLGIIAQMLSGCEICLCNDLTKLYEKIYRGTPQKIMEELLDNPCAQKGEYTLVLQAGIKPHGISGNDASLPPTGALPSLEAEIIDYIIKNGGTIKDAVSALQEIYKGRISKRQIYSSSLNLKKLMADLFVI